jgi:hypothetical protein
LSPKPANVRLVDTDAQCFAVGGMNPDAGTDDSGIFLTTDGVWSTTVFGWLNILCLAARGTRVKAGVSEVEHVVFETLGRETALLVDQRRPSGNHAALFNRKR